MYEVFLSFKNTLGKRKDGSEIYTADRAIAQKLYDELKKVGISVFYSNAEVRLSGDSQWQELIDRALMESKVIIVIGTNPEYILSNRVAYEWRYFRDQIDRGRARGMLCVMEGFDLGELPPAFTGVENISPRNVEGIIDMTRRMLKRLYAEIAVDPTSAQPSELKIKLAPAAEVDSVPASMPEAAQKSEPKPELTSDRKSEPKSKGKLMILAACVVVLVIGVVGLLVRGVLGGKSGNENQVSSVSSEPVVKDGLYTIDSITYRIENGKATVIGCRNDATEVVIPAEVEGVSVIAVSNSAFYWHTSLKSITLPDSVTSIGDSAFWGCESLTSIDIPDSVTSIGDGAFRFCSLLTNITLPDSVTSIGDGAFSYCYDLTVYAPHEPSYYGYRLDAGVDWETK